ncbi:hypothetical protein M409DRAFT_66146 [Zasmidium cellare ATCC 36951]|uniref:Major facilitator superfamily (MFS) profile domain-containing protein n=1 Tax=Zasmidium cellare ATCC 36951 TaxID=1080233 RepID=A0A6A6CKC9_ZASCE|nr:uncharacterized protein M409DRAFT_66146 [Zasmidium cellare ATCC 36951]KAF2167063.1 hypothetical protein M409DRAFT_66146 [Zasmidium cellare ATCC 36951]
MAVPINAVPSHNVEKVMYSATVHTTEKTLKSLDEAYDFLCSHDANRDAADLDIKRIRRKIDYWILPIFYLNYLLQFLDKSLLGYAIIMGLEKDLGLKGNELNNIASSLWWAYLVASAFVGPVLNKVPIARFLAFCLTCWGIVISCTAAVQGFGGMMGIRVLMGVFDAAIPPALMLLTSQYYRKDEAALRFELWFTAAGSGLVFGGFISFGFQFVHTAGLEGWRIMFLVLGVVSVLLGLVTWWLLPDTPMNARFLTDAEKTAVIQYVAVNQTGVSSHKFERSHIIAALTDPQIWLLTIGNIVVSTGAGILGIYGVTLIRSFGFTSKEAALLTAPAGAIAVILSILAAFTLRYRWMPRWAVAMTGYGLSLLGSCLVAFLPKSNRAGNLIGMWMVACSIPTIALKYHWITANVAGHTKRSIATASVSAATAIGNIIGPYAVQKNDAPSYQPARLTLVAVKAGAIVLIGALAIYYWCANRSRDRVFGPPPTQEDDSLSEASVRSDVWANLTDKERKTFRYVL